MNRLTRLDNDSYTYFSDDDECYHYGEYTSGGGFKASVTNNKIFSLKTKPTASSGALYHKQQAIAYWGSVISATINIARIVGSTTFVPMPCSKSEDHADYDDRMLRVLQVLKRSHPTIDIRPILTQTTARPSQHQGGRLRPSQLMQSMEINDKYLNTPLNRNIIILDDVVTMGASFNAAKTIISKQPEVNKVIGLFLAKTVWPRSELDDFIDSL